MSYTNLIMLSASIPQYKSGKGKDKEEDLGELDSEEAFNRVFGGV